MPFRFDILAQLANIPARITMHKLLRLSKETREALRDALANSESFLTYMPEIPKDDTQSACPKCHHVQSTVPAITFTAEDMLLKNNKYDRPLYYTGYIGTTCIERVQVDLGSALSISTKGSSTSSAYHYICCPQPLQQYTILMQGVVIRLGRFDSVAK